MSRHPSAAGFFPAPFHILVGHRQRGGKVFRTVAKSHVYRHSAKPGCRQMDTVRLVHVFRFKPLNDNTLTVFLGRGVGIILCPRSVAERHRIVTRLEMEAIIALVGCEQGNKVHITSGEFACGQTMHLGMFSGAWYHIATIETLVVVDVTQCIVQVTALTHSRTDVSQ